MEQDAEYEAEQLQYQDEGQYVTEGEYMDAGQQGDEPFNTPMGAEDQYMYMDNESQDIDVNAMLDDIESIISLPRNGD